MGHSISSNFVVCCNSTSFENNKINLCLEHHATTISSCIASKLDDSSHFEIPQFFATVAFSIPSKLKINHDAINNNFLWSYIKLIEAKYSILIFFAKNCPLTIAPGYLILSEIIMSSPNNTRYYDYYALL